MLLTRLLMHLPHLYKGLLQIGDAYTTNTHYSCSSKLYCKSCTFSGVPGLFCKIDTLVLRCIFNFSPAQWRNLSSCQDLSFRCTFNLGKVSPPLKLVTEITQRTKLSRSQQPDDYHRTPDAQADSHLNIIQVYPTNNV